jgi:predicted metalloendopeptidase
MANVTLYGNDTISVNELEYLRQASNIIEQTSPYIIQNYFIWRFLMARMSSMPKTYRTIRERFNQIFHGTSAEEARSSICGNYVNFNMGFAVSKIFIEKYFDATARNEARLTAVVRILLVRHM